jgi:hypothetical protein
MMYRITFLTNLGVVNYLVDEAVVMKRTEQIMACPGAFDVQIEMES